MIGDSILQRIHSREAENSWSSSPKEANQNRILQKIIDNKGISRAQIARDTMLSRATVSMLTDEMLQEGVIVTNGIGDIDTSGRKPTRLEINPAYAQIITVVLRKSEMRYVLYDLMLRPLDSFQAPITYNNGFAKDIIKTIKENSNGLDWDRCACFCISTSSTILTDTWELLSTIMDIEPGYHFIEDMRIQLGRIPLLVSNGSPMLAYAEKAFGKGQGVANLIYINIAEGIGAGIIMDNKLFKGAYGRAGEFGHMSIDINGPACPCGKRGCIDLYLKRDAILSAFRSSWAKNHSGELTGFDEIAQMLRSRDEDGINAAMGLSGKLAFALSNLICVFNPQKIVLGGGVQELGEVFFSQLNDSIMALSSKGTLWTRKLALAYSVLDEHAENLGIAKYFLDQVFKYPYYCEGQLFL